MDRKQVLQDHLYQIKKKAKGIGKDITVMEICGGHTNIIMKYGIRDILPDNINLISGPGCPVCVSGQYDIDCIIELATHDIPIATYGDMLKVPGSTATLDDIRAQGGIVLDIYSTTEVIKLQKQYPNIVFFGIGFETTAPMTTSLLERNICVYSVHKLVPPAMMTLIQGDVHIDGFINPGHVSTIIGSDAYTHIPIPQVIAGFTPERILRAIRILLSLIEDKKNIVMNGYPEAVKKQGNVTAQKALTKHFTVSDSRWRGLGMLPRSGLEVKKDTLNAKIKYEQLLKQVPMPTKTACRCGDVLKGLIEPIACPLYRKTCTPDHPQGACMVSEEGSCAISFRYGK